MFGEKVVLRILDPTTAQMGIDVGYDEDQKNSIWMPWLSHKV